MTTHAYTAATHPLPRRISTTSEDANPPTECPLGDAEQRCRIHLVEFAGFITLEYAPELDHAHTLQGFRTAHQGSPKSPSTTGQIVCYLNRTYHVLPTPAR